MPQDHRVTGKHLDASIREAKLREELLYKNPRMTDGDRVALALALCISAGIVLGALAAALL